MRSERDRCIALAGIFQAAELASQVARRGMADIQSMEASIYSLFQTDADSVDAVYNGLAGVATGFRILEDQLSSSKRRNMEVTRYVISLLHLERKLAKNPQVLDRLAQGIHETTARLTHFPMLHANILSGLAGIYAETISTLKPRIMVHGEPLYLQNPENVSRIRALLLAGIRSAMLWRQCGGGRLQILFGRKKLLRCAHDLRTKQSV